MPLEENEFSSIISRDIACQLTGDASKYQNNPTLEVAWACNAAERASIHMNLLLSCDTRNLSLHKHSRMVYDHFRSLFPDMNVKTVAEKELKNENKKKWFEFCENLKDTIEEYNLGTLLRIRANGVYSEENTIVVPKVIYLAIEAARNFEGINEEAKEHYTEEHEKVSREGGNIC
ncbi:unnamed protein product [Enterobius vermicularis]|uniref:Polysacc_synt_4 domain-containing protein n=1 Tax=Enterobius vermicularis TaxID=51028 RepID=A0A0N4UVU8_ENTVE|nr:unnamed protein product [Enterobius vermicularis]